MLTSRTIALSILLLSSTESLWAQPVLSYLIPDIGAPGMAIYVEFIAPTRADLTGTAFRNIDGITLNNPSDAFRIELVRPSDSSKIVFGPCILSWNGRLVSTIAYIHPSATPNSWDWRQLSPEWRIPLRLRTPNGVTGVDTFYIVQPTPAGDVRSRNENVLGRPPLGIRSRRGALLFDSLILGARTYTIALDDPDQNLTNGNQGYLPVVLMCKGPLRGASLHQTTLSVNATGSDGGPGGGGGAGEFADIAGPGSPGGNGYTGGGQGGTNSPNSYRSPGTGTGGSDGRSLNGVLPGTPEGAYESSGGGTGHPFGTSGIGCNSGTNCNPVGGYGGGSGVIDNHDGAGSGYATPGSSTNANNGGMAHGNSMIVPLAGGSGGASGNPRNSSFPFTALGGKGGGGGGAIAVVAPTIENLGITANGGDGSGQGTSQSRRGGGGSGGAIHIASSLVVNQLNLSVTGGGQTAPFNKGGEGYARIDAGVVSSVIPPSIYLGPTLDTLSSIGRTFTLSGSGGVGKTILLFIKPSNGQWTLHDSIIVGGNGRWRYNTITPRGAQYLYIAAAQREVASSLSRFSVVPTAVFSPVSGRILAVAPSVDVIPSQVDMGRISCADNAGFKLDTVILYNNTGQTLRIRGQGFINPANGFRIVRPTPLQGSLASGDSLIIVIEFKVPSDRYGPLTDTLIVLSEGINDPIARIPVRIVVDKVGLALTDTTLQKIISAIDFSQTCQGQSKELTFVLRVIGNYPVTINRISTLGPLFTVGTPSRSILQPIDTIHLHLRASPPAVGEYSDTLQIEIDLCQQIIAIPLRVTGIASRLIGIGPNQHGTVDFGNVRLGNARTSRVGIVNANDESIVVIATHEPREPFTRRIVPGGSFPLSLRRQDTIKIDITFQPTSLGISRDSLVVVSQHSDLACPDTLRFSLIGNGTLSTVDPSHTILDFDTLFCGSLLDTLWLRNTGNQTATIFFPAVISGSDASFFSIIQQPLSEYQLQPSDSVQIVIRAQTNSSEPSGIKTALFEVPVQDDTIRLIQVQLQMYHQPLTIEWSPQPYVLVDVPINHTTQSQPPLTLRNNGTVEVCIARVRPTRAEIVPINTSITIPPYGKSRDLYFSVTPGSLTIIEDTITITLSCPCLDSIRIPIRIIPTNNALAITPRPIQFGTLPPCSTEKQILTIRNNDPRGAAILESVSIGGRDYTSYKITNKPWATLPYTIPAGFAITVQVEFNPAGTIPGVKQAYIAFQYTINGEVVSDTVRLHGERTVPFEMDPASLDFGEVKVGETRTLPLILTNNFSRSLTFSFGVAQWYEYFIINPYVLNVDVATKYGTIDIEFKAQSEGEFVDTLWIRFTSTGLGCADSIPYILRAVALPGIGFWIWTDSQRILDPHEQNVALRFYGKIDTSVTLRSAQLFTVIDLPNQLFMPTGVRAHSGRIQSFNARTHSRHIITVIIDTLLNSVSNEPTLLFELIGNAILGDRQCDSIYIRQARWTNTGIRPTLWHDTTTGNGQLCLILCDAGGTRFLGSSLQLPSLTATPNPASNEVTLTIVAHEKGGYKLELVSQVGEIVTACPLGVLPAGTIKRIHLDLLPYAAGLYYVRLQTPSRVVSVPLIHVP